MSGIAQTVEKIRLGDVRTIARTISQVENRTDPSSTEILRQLFAHSGKAFILGVTGSPGVGKSTLVDCLARHYRQQELKVGIIAVDPTSPFSGGAILGDRVRMQRLATDPGVFIRSMATRGKLGGLSSAVQEALIILDAAGFDILIVETVGVGQDEVDIARAAQATLVVLIPGLGDDVQAVKAGIMEIGDIFALNKADRQEVNKAEADLRASLSLSPRQDGWRPPLVRTVATQCQGIQELDQAIEDFRGRPQGRSASRHRALRLYRQLLVEMLQDRLARRILESLPECELDGYAEKMMTRELDPFTIVDRLLSRAGMGEKKP